MKCIYDLLFFGDSTATPAPPSVDQMLSGVSKYIRRILRGKTNEDEPLRATPVKPFQNVTLAMIVETFEM